MSGWHYGDVWDVIAEVRGEVYMQHADFAAMNKKQEAKGDRLFANPRNGFARRHPVQNTDAKEVVCGQREPDFVHEGAR